jgi:hypothetical protein
VKPIHFPDKLHKSVANSLESFRGAALNQQTLDQNIHTAQLCNLKRRRLRLTEAPPSIFSPIESIFLAHSRPKKQVQSIARSPCTESMFITHTCKAETPTVCPFPLSTHKFFLVFGFAFILSHVINNTLDVGMLRFAQSSLLSDVAHIIILYTFTKMQLIILALQRQPRLGRIVFA